jgi:hypothetical protein
MENISTIREIINLWPKRQALADDLNATFDDFKVTAGMVHKWAENGSVPSKYQHHLIECGLARGFPITAELLVTLHAPKVDAA